MKTKLIGFALLLALLAAALPAAASVPAVINYQGRLTQPSGAPVADGTYSMLFSIYAAPTGGTALWSETNPAVAVKGGLFAAMLGSVVSLPTSIFDNPATYFAVKVGSDPEMSPRQLIASVGYSVKAGSADLATTVPDAAITTSKLNSASVTADKLASGAVTVDKLATGIATPVGTIVMWSGATTAIPTGWAPCDGTGGRPDLRDKFIVGAGLGYVVGATGGEATHTLTVAEMPAHTHRERSSNTSGYGGADGVASGTGWSNSSHFSDWNTDTTGGGAAHENRPPYYALCYIMKLAY